MPTISPPTILVLFGATGDLARLKLLPALRNLWIEGRLPHNFQLVATGRRQMSTADYVQYLAEVDSHPFKQDLSILNLQYLQLDFDQELGFKPLQELLQQHEGAKFLFYMAVGADVLHTCVDEFSQPDFREAINHTESIVVVEKPFGENLVDARDLGRKLSSIFGVRKVFRNDHYLNKDTVQAIVPIRQYDPEMQHILTKDEVAEIQIIAVEKVDLGTRASYFDGRGMVVDWVQSHLLQILATLCADLDNDSFCLSKAEFIDSLELQPDSIIRAQYEGYSDMPDVKPELHTETFFAGQFSSSLPQWQGVTFSLITGKALAEKEVVINLRLKHPHPKLGNSIELFIDPAGGNHMLGKLSGDEYEDTIVQALHDQWEKFVSQQEVEAQWRITEKIRSSLQDSPLEYYQKGVSYKHFCTENWCIHL